MFNIVHIMQSIQLAPDLRVFVNEWNHRLFYHTQPHTVHLNARSSLTGLREEEREMLPTLSTLVWVSSRGHRWGAVSSLVRSKAAQVRRGVVLMGECLLCPAAP